MGRPPLPLGTAGKVNTFLMPDGSWRARCNFRDFDGVTRSVARYAADEDKARRALAEHLRERNYRGPKLISASMRVSELLAEWLERVDEDAGLAIGTRQHYHKISATYVAPALGGYRVCEVDVPAVDHALRTIAKSRGYSIAKSSRTVLMGALGLATSMGALKTNPVRDVGRLRGNPRKQPRALEPDDITDLIDRVRASARAADLDLPDLVEHLLYTGARIGEALACRAETLRLTETADGDFEGAWLVDSTVVRVKGSGLIIQSKPKTESSRRLLVLPPGCVQMHLRRRTELRLPGPQGVVFASPFRKTLRDPSNVAGDLREMLRHLYCLTCDGSGYEQRAPGQLRRVCRAEGDDRYDWVVFHTFRKTVATMFDVAGRSAREAAGQLGHANTAMTQKVYFDTRIASGAARTVLDR